MDARSKQLDAKERGILEHRLSAIDATLAALSEREHSAEQAAAAEQLMKERQLVAATLAENRAGMEDCR